MCPSRSVIAQVLLSGQMVFATSTKWAGESLQEGVHIVSIASSTDTSQKIGTARVIYHAAHFERTLLGQTDQPIVVRNGITYDLDLSQGVDQMNGLMNPFINRMRGILAILVVVSHIVGIAFTYPTTHDAFQNALAPLFMFTGFNYVIGFIVVSGYCIVRSTLARGPKFSLIQYTALRLTRIYPSLIICACIAGVVELVFFGHPSRIAVWNAGLTLHNFVVSIFGMSGFYGQFGSYAPSYTVSYELLFYLIWGAVFALTPTRFTLPISLLAGVCLYFAFPLNYSFAMVLFFVWLIGAALAIHEDGVIKIARRVPL